MSSRYWHALHRGVKAALSPGFRDDRGRACRLGAADEIDRIADSNVELRRLADRLAMLRADHRKPKLRGAYTVVVIVAIHVAIALICIGGVLRNGWFFFAVVVLGLATWASAVLFRKVREPLEPALAAAVLDDGICAACAYPLAGVPAVEGMIVCPECGAAWRADRVQRCISLSPDSTARRGLLRAAVSYHVQQGKNWDRKRIDDDRGRPRVIAPVRRAAAESRRVPEPLRARLEAAVAIARPMGRWRRWAYVAMFPVFIAVIVVLGEFPIGAVPIFCVLFAYSIRTSLRSDLGREVREMRAVYLGVRLCPACLADLQGLAPEADGCVRCAACAAAWRMDREAGVDLSGGCPRCNYDLRGLTPEGDATIRCPECGGVWQAVAAAERQA